MDKKIFVKNSYYEGLLQDLFCGNDGFFSIFMHFFYQYNQIFCFNQNFKEEFKLLCDKELEACEIISALIIQIGGDAKYYSSMRKFLSGSKIDYVKNFKMMLENDIELAEKSLLDVKSALCKIENMQIKTDLRKILVLKNEELEIIKKIYLNAIENKNS